MRIMEIVSGAGLNGAIVHCLELSRALALRGHRVTLVCRPDAWIGRQPLPPGVDRIESTLDRWPFAELRRLAAIARDQSIDVVHTHQSRANMFGVAMRWMGGPPVVATAHNRLIQLHWMWNDHVIAATAATARFHRRYNFCWSRRLDVIHCFVDWRRLAETSTAADVADRPIRRQFGIPDSAPVLVYAGQLTPRKGLVFLVEALPKILSERPDARLLVVGAGSPDYTALVVDRARRLGVLHAFLMLGQRADLADLFRQADLFVLPSLEEQLPLVILEAMACRLPIVASAVGGIPECVRDGVEGFLTPPADADALADAVLKLTGDSQLRAAMGRAALEQVRREFSLETQTARVESLFERVAARTSRRRKEA